ncbi:hypothetical protein BX600DRAFT_502655 [Xylariales sp. PMI_506]|nr:hypothetical protein BX600DRAFT_502655 [Xylariales sp. PMI_506]
MDQTSSLRCNPIPKPEGSLVDFGIEVSGLDLENLTDTDFDSLREILYTHQVVVIRNQQALSPSAQYQLTRRFDPSAEVYGLGSRALDKRSVLFADLKTIPSQPQVQVIGHGFVKSIEGLTDVQLLHPHHRVHHKQPIPEEEDLNYTRFYRWHIDAAFYDLEPSRVTTLFAVQVPSGRRQTLRYDDGSSDSLDVSLGTTAFFSGYKLYELLSEEEKEFVRKSKAEFAPHPHIWFSRAKCRSTGLGLLTEGLELTEDELPPIEAEKIKIYPMVWKNPVTGKYALMTPSPPLRKIHLANGEVIDNLAEVRETMYKLHRRAIDPKYVYTHEWAEGDLVLFNNHGVMHSVVGSFAGDEVRVMRQCNLASNHPPLGPETIDEGVAI